LLIYCRFDVCVDANVQSFVYPKMIAAASANPGDAPATVCCDPSEKVTPFDPNVTFAVIDTLFGNRRVLPVKSIRSNFAAVFAAEGIEGMLFSFFFYLLPSDDDNT
jgi:hypothetical protein